LVREYLYDDALENKLYQDYMGEKVRNEHLPRFVWHCQETQNHIVLELKLAVDTLKTVNPEADTHKNAKIFTTLPEILLQNLWNLDITPYLETAYPDAERLAKKIYEKSMPLIQYDKSEAVRHTLKMFLSLQPGDYREKLRKFLAPNFPSREHVKGTDFLDAHVFSSVSVLDSLPLPAIIPYEQSMKGYLALPASNRQQLHVFPAEQHAVLFEEKLPGVKEPQQAFHPRFISYLEHLELTKLFASCAVYDLIPNIFQYDVHQYYLEISDKSGKSRYLLTQEGEFDKPTPLQALQAFVKGTVKTEAGEDISIPIERIENFIKQNPPSKKLLQKKETEIITMKTNQEVSSKVRNLLSFIHLVLEKDIKRMAK
jgi:hypothetical protein